MNLGLAAAVLGFAPFISYWLQWLFSKKSGQLQSFNRHWTCRYSDWIFVPFNAIFPFSVSAQPVLFPLAFLIGLAGSFAIHKSWARQGLKSGGCHFFVRQSISFSPAGRVHLFFSSLETALILLLLLFGSGNFFTLIALVILAVFAALLAIGSGMIHGGKVQTGDAVVAAVLAAAVVAKGFALFMMR